MALGNAIAGLNWLAVIAAAATALALGALWYSRRLFGEIWMQEIGLTEDAVRQSNLPLILGGTFVLQFVAATALALLLGPDSNWLTGLEAGLLVGLCWIATAYGITYFFERRSLRLYFINAAHYVLMFASMGAIIGVLN